MRPFFPTVLAALVAAAFTVSPHGAVAGTADARPLIGITVDVGGLERDGKFTLNSSYADAITSAGGIPLMLPPVEDLETTRRYVELCDGFVFSGGRDISPARYGDAEEHPTLKLLNPRRENFDISLIKAVFEAGKPILGVCLGSQELNVAMGGGLMQDIPSQTSTTINHKPGNSALHHEIEITTGSLLHDVVSTTSLQVNSIHHQASDRLGSGVVVMARAPDGIVEAFQVTTAKAFCVGVQWHPEALTEHPEHLAVYEALVKAAAENKAGR